MYGLSHLKAVVKQPERALIEIGRNQHRIDPRYSNAGATHILDEDWDVLVILDACRYDYFEEIIGLPGETSFRYSAGSNSPEFIKENFTGETLYGTVVVSANPWYQKLREDIDLEFYELIYVDGDDSITGCRPSTVSKRALEENKEHPNKRLIIHYMQPHSPYIGPTGGQIEQCGPTDVTILENNIDGETLEKAYRENLEIVLDEVGQLFTSIRGKFVVTADHGELLGERPYVLPIQDFGHPWGVYCKELTKVPWHTYKNGERKVKSAEKSISSEIDSDVEKDLEALGYKM